MVEDVHSDLTRAALMVAFDPRALIDPLAADAGARLNALAAVATEVQVGDRWLWRLTPDAQRAGLARLPSGKERAALLAGLPSTGGDAMASALRQVLEAGATPPEVARLRRSAPRGADLPKLLGLMQAVELLQSAGVTLEGWAADPRKVRNLSRGAVQADKAAASEQILPWKLHGRATELSALRDFAKDGIVRSPPIVASADWSTSAPPTVILSGLGGSGKSALLEALRRRLARDHSILRVTFDLDLPALRAGHRVALTQELLRQIGAERPDLDDRLSAIRQTLRGGVAATTEGIDPSREASAVFASLTDLNTLLSSEGKDEPICLVLIFDTFEEALILGPDRVRLIADWIGLVGKHRLRPRVILSGREADSLTRSPLPDLAVQGTLSLGDLAPKAGRDLLQDQFDRKGIAAKRLVPKLVDVFGSDPLTLLMLARFAASILKEGGDVRQVLTDLASGDASEARDQLNGEMRQAFLFSRILNRLPTQELQAVASPGLVLRQVTPELILEVLAKPCKLKETRTLAEAEALFDRLASMVWLVRPVGGAARVVAHVPDLRRRMLPQLLLDPVAREVVKAAVDWFEARASAGDAGADLDAIYYRALDDPDTLTHDPVVLRQLADHLGPAIADLEFAQDRFRDALGRVVSQEAVEALDRGAVQKGARDRRRKFQLSEGLESAVVEESADIEVTTGEPVSPDLIAARFAALDLSQVAAEAAGLVQRLLDGLPGTIPQLSPTGEMTSDDLQGLSVAALQAATACLAPEVGPGPGAALRAAVRDWLGNPDRRETLVASYASVMQQSSQLWPTKLVGVLVLALADGESLSNLGEPLSEAVRGMAQVTHSPFGWRALRVVGPLREDAGVKGVALAYLAPEVLPFVSASVIQTEAPEVAETFRTILNSEGQVSISDHNRIDGTLFREDVTLQEKLPMIGRLAATVPGRLPEFHGAFRLILGSTDLPAAMVQEAVGFVARFVPWWPKELSAEAFADAPFSPTLISSLIDTADRCGRLPDLAAALARQAGAPASCGRLSALIEAAVAHYRRAAGVADQG